MKTICIFLAEGFEEVEAMLPLDILRRGGLDVQTVSVADQPWVTGAHGIAVQADKMFDEVNPENVEMIVLPGGMPGALHLDAHPGLGRLIMEAAAEGKLLAAICAAPMVYGKRGLLKGRKATCYPGFEQYLEGAACSGRMVETDANFILAKGPAAAAEFGFALLERLAGAEKMMEVKKGMLFA